jgi:hypothetical protein
MVFDGGVRYLRLVWDGSLLPDQIQMNPQHPVGAQISLCVVDRAVASANEVLALS